MGIDLGLEHIQLRLALAGLGIRNFLDHIRNAVQHLVKGLAQPPYLVLPPDGGAYLKIPLLNLQRYPVQPDQR
ncbi:hypothetical protein D3C81_2162200 [compost metagenome]